MDTAEHAAVRARAIERRLGGMVCDVRWSPRDSAYIAFGAEFPELTCADAWSSRAAINGLEDKIRAALSAEPSRTVEV
ncbi:hypothetical protein [Nocardia sp. NBC_00403]|uniref:hypothetical protein n=1 Tax=Nocardia sp. NBC_00403 TaxID=2975990 RepID=UPI002E1BD720